MRNIEEIKTYLMLSNRRGEDEISKNLINDAKKVEEKYKKELEDGIYEYATLSDFINNPFILEDEDLVSELKEIERIGGIVVYEPILCEKIKNMDFSQLLKELVEKCKNCDNYMTENHERCHSCWMVNIVKRYDKQNYKKEDK